MRIAEYKLKVRGEPWEETPVFVEVDIDSVEDIIQQEALEDDFQMPGIPFADLADGIANGLARVYQCEVRWNTKGSFQGHYVGRGTREPAIEEEVEYNESDWWN